MRVLLVDDHALFAQSLAIVLSDFPSIEQFSNIKSVDEIEATIEGDKPDILLMDINLGKLSEEDGLLLLAGGTKRKEIAEQLFMSERTVSNHLQHIFEKLEVSSSVEAVTKAIQLGYIPPL